MPIATADRSASGGEQRRKFKAGQEKRDGYLAAVRDGMSKKDAARHVGWMHLNSVYHARREYPEWAKLVDLAWSAGRALQKQSRDEAKRALDPKAFVGANVEEATEAEFRAFVQLYFPDRRPHLSHQMQIVKELSNLGPREVCLFLLWPEAGKTSTLEDYMCKHLASKDADHRFRIVSEGQDLAKRIVGTCQRRFTDEGNYGGFIRKYGPFYEKGQERRGRPWTTDQFTILQNSGGERDRSIVASGWTGAVYGSRIDTLILDDIQSQRNFNASEEIFARIRGTFFNRGLEMRTLIVGTRIGPGDFYDRMIDAGLVTRKIILPAMDRDGEPTVPAFWDKEIFHSKRGERPGPCCSGFRECPHDGSKLTPREFMELIRHQSGEDVWWSAYQQNPAANERTTFGSLLERCLDHERSVGQLPKSA